MNLPSCKPFVPFVPSFQWHTGLLDCLILIPWLSDSTTGYLYSRICWRRSEILPCIRNDTFYFSEHCGCVILLSLRVDGRFQRVLAQLTVILTILSHDSESPVW